MRTGNANFNALNTRVQHPVGLVGFDGVTRRYCTDEFADISSNEKTYLNRLNYKFPRIDLLNGRNAGGQVDITIVDKGLDFVNVLKDNHLHGKDVTVKLGFKTLDEADFITLPGMQINGNIVVSEDQLEFDLVGRDVQRLLHGQVFRSVPTTRLDGAHDDTDPTLFQVGQNTTFLGTTEDAYPGSNPLGPGGAGEEGPFLIVGDSEIVEYTGTSGSNQFTPVNRGLFGTSAQNHEDGTEVRQCYVFLLMYSHILLYILHTSDGGDGHPFYDLGWNGFGLGLPEDQVDTIGIETLGYLHNSMPFWLAPSKPVDAATWIGDWILKPNAWYTFLDGSGRVTTKTFDLLEVQESYASVTSIPTGDIEHSSFAQRNDMLINHMSVEHNIDPVSQSMTKTRRFQLDGSEDEYGRTPEKAFVLRTASYHESALDVFENPAPQPTAEMLKYDLLSRYMYFFSNPPGIYDITTKPQHWLIQQGDYLDISETEFPDFITGTRGWSAKNSIILTQEIDLFSDDPLVRFEGLTWQLLDKVSGSFYDITKRTDTEEFDVTSISTTWEDSVPGTPQGRAIVFVIDVVQPGLSPGAGQVSTWIEFRWNYPDAGTQILTRRIYPIRYDAESSDTFRIKVMLVNPGGFENIFSGSMHYISGYDEIFQLKEFWWLDFSKEITEIV